MSTLRRVWDDLGGDAAELDAVAAGGHPSLPSPLPVAALVRDAVAAASLAGSAVAEGGVRTVRLDPDRLRTAVTSERVVRVDGRPPDVWVDLSGFFRSADGWLRTHANYPHHRAALLRGLGLPPDASRDAAVAAIAELPAERAEASIVAAGGVAARVREHWDFVPGPLVGYRTTAPIEVVPGPIDAPLRNLRVLDLTRVLAGPVATRVLAQLGADVLRVDAPFLPETPWIHLDTGAGKRSTLLDAGSDRFRELIAGADVLVTGYRPGSAVSSLERDGLILGRVRAWRTGGGRGFDSIVQAATGIAHRLAGPDGVPGALPAQALDHSAGYLLAAGILTAIRRREAATVEVTLEDMARELFSLPEPTGSAEAREPSTVTYGDLTIARPAVAYDGLPDGWPSPPRPWGSDEAAWLS